MKTLQPIEFTNREQFLIAFYRDPSLSGGRWSVVLDWSVVVGSLGLLGVWAVSDEIFFGLAAYAAVLTRLIAYVSRSRQFTEDLRSVLRKYDDRVRAFDSPTVAAGEEGKPSVGR